TWMKQKLILHEDALEKLEHVLPEKIYVPKSNSEEVQLPRNIWGAMTQKFGYSLPEGKSETITRSDWEDFLTQNEAKVKAWQADSSEDLWAKHLQEAMRDGGVLASRADVIQMIHKKWDESQSLIKEEVKKELDKLTDTRQQNNRGGIVASEVI